MSLVYKDASEPFDSDIRLRRFGVSSSAEISFSGYGKPEKDELPQDVYLVIIGPGRPIYQHYGHVGLVLDYKSIGRIMVDYGIFDPDQKNFISNFIHGNMYYSAYLHKIHPEWGRIADDEHRSVRVYKLAMSDSQKDSLQRFLSYNTEDINSFYLYDFFKDNCSTRIRDILDRVYDGKLSSLSSSVPMGTYRTLIERAERPYFWSEAFYNAGLGSVVDKPVPYYDAMFLPEYLEEGVKEMGIAEIVYTPDYPVDFKPSVVKGENLKPNYLLYFIITAAFVFINLAYSFAALKFDRRFSRITASGAILPEILFALLSVVYLYAEIFTIHWFTWFNYSLMFMNPFLFVTAYYSFRYAFYGDRYEEKYISCHLCVVVLSLLSFVLKIFYRQKNLFLILIFLFYNISLLLPFASEIIKETKEKSWEILEKIRNTHFFKKR